MQYEMYPKSWAKNRKEIFFMKYDLNFKFDCVRKRKEGKEIIKSCESFSTRKVLRRIWELTIH